MKKEKYIRICPSCGGTDIGIPPAGMDLRLTVPDYCRKCRGMGRFPEVKSSEVEKFRKKLKNNQRF